MLLTMCSQPTAGVASLPVLQSFTETMMSADAVSAVITKPAGTVDGELLIAIVTTAEGLLTNNTAPAGWTTFIDNANDGALVWKPNTSVFYKFASSEPSNYTFSFSVPTRGALQVLRFDKADPTTPLTAGLLTKDADTTINASGVTTTSDNSVVLTLLTTANTTRTESLLPTTPTLIANSKPANNSGAGWIMSYRLDMPTAGSTSAESATLSGTNGNIGFQIVINPLFE